MSLVLAAFCHHGSLVLLCLLYGKASVIVEGSVIANDVDGIAEGVWQML
jgi:hypothetical protein